MSTETPWIKAAASGGNGQCVEMRRAADGLVEVRDTKDRAGGTQRYTAGEFAAWLEGAKKGEFDHLV